MVDIETAIALLQTYIGTVATVWAIGIAVYILIWEYFERKVYEGQRFDECRLKRYERVFFGYFAASFLSFLAIVASVVALLCNPLDWLWVPTVLFLGTITAFLWLFTFEVRSSILHIRKRLKQLKVQ